MPQDKQHKKKSKKKRQPSFTLPKNPYNYKYGSVRSLSKNKAPLVGTWTRLRTPGKLGQRDQNIKDRCTNGFLKLNEKVSQNLDVHEISSWMQKQKELYVRHKRPPAVPRRSPETKITTTELQPKEVGQVDSAGPPPDYEDDEQAPESGYITPEQQSSELEYPVPSQQRGAQPAQISPSGSVSSCHSTPRHMDRGYTTMIQAEVHASCPADNRDSIASLGSVPSVPPPPPPQDAMALQVNPIHGASMKHASMMSASSGSSSGTLHDPYQPDDLYQHYIAPSDGADRFTRQLAYGTAAPSLVSQNGAPETNMYETKLPTRGAQGTPGVAHLTSRPLPSPPGDEGPYNTMVCPRQNGTPNFANSATMPNTRGFVSPTARSPTLEEFPPPPPQFAGGEVMTSPRHQFTSRNEPTSAASQQMVADSSLTNNSLPFPVKLRPTGSTLLKDGHGDTSVYHYKDSIDVFNIVVPPPSCQAKKPAPAVQPKSRPVHQLPVSTFPSSSSSSAVPPAPSPQFPAPPSPISPQSYAEIVTEPVMPPPPPLPAGGITADLASRIQEWSISNQDRPSRPGRQQTADAHTALLSQIQTGIKLRKSPFSNKLFDSAQRDDSPIQQTGVATSPNPDYVYTDFIETCSTVSGESSSSGCHSNSSYSNSTTGSPPPQTLPKPRKQLPVTNKMSASDTNTKTASVNPDDIKIDVTQLPGYQPIPSNCPAWKANLIEKKNQQLEEEARRKLIAQREEENRWKDIPEWKRNLIIEKEKRKVAPLEAERRKREEEMAKLQAMPDWKRDLILKKRGDQ